MTQKIKDYLGVAIIIAVLALGVAALSYVHTYSRSSEPNNYRSFSVTGEGKVVAVPDIASFSFSVTTQGGPDLGALQKDNTDSVNSALTFVKSKGVADKDVKTEGYNVEPRYQTYNCTPSILGAVSPCPPSEIVGYTVTQSVQVKVRDFAKIGDLISGVVEHGANTVSSLQFTLDDPSKAQSGARAEAIIKAKEKARSIADAGGFRIGKLLSIDEGGYPQPMYMNELGGGYAGVSMKAAAPVIEPGSQEVSVTATLRYEIR